MLTLKMLKDMPEHTLFATGIAKDQPGGLNMNRTGKDLRWVAVRGEIHDWTIYCHWAEHDIHWIRRSGDKVIDKEHIQRLVPCDDDAISMYRL